MLPGKKPDPPNQNRFQRLSESDILISSARYTDCNTKYQSGGDSWQLCGFQRTVIKKTKLSPPTLPPRTLESKKNIFHQQSIMWTPNRNGGIVAGFPKVLFSGPLPLITIPLVCVDELKSKNTRIKIQHQHDLWLSKFSQFLFPWCRS